MDSDSNLYPPFLKDRERSSSAYYLNFKITIDLGDYQKICDDIDNSTSLDLMEFQSFEHQDQENSFDLIDSDVSSNSNLLLTGDNNQVYIDDDKTYEVNHYHIDDTVSNGIEGSNCSCDGEFGNRGNGFAIDTKNSNNLCVNGSNTTCYNQIKRLNCDVKSDSWSYMQNETKNETNESHHLLAGLIEEVKTQQNANSHKRNYEYSFNNNDNVGYSETFYNDDDDPADNTEQTNNMECIIDDAKNNFEYLTLATQVSFGTFESTINPNSIYLRSPNNIEDCFQDYDLTKIDITPINVNYPVSVAENKEEINDEDYFCGKRIDYSFSCVKDDNGEFDMDNNSINGHMPVNKIEGINGGDNIMKNNGGFHKNDKRDVNNDEDEYVENPKNIKKQKVEHKSSPVNSKESCSSRNNNKNDKELRVLGPYEKSRRGPLEQPIEQIVRVQNYILITNIINSKINKNIAERPRHDQIYNSLLKDAVVSKTIEKYSNLLEIDTSLKSIELVKLSNDEMDKISRFEIIDENKWKYEYFIHNMSNNCTNISRFKKHFNHIEYSKEWVYFENKFDQPMFQIGKGELPLRFCNQLGNFYEPFILRERRKDKYLMTQDEAYNRYKRHIDIENLTNFDDNSYEVEAMCPYCPINTNDFSINVKNLNNYFFGRNNSEYLHHITKHHGIYSNGDEQKLPLYVIKDHNGKFKAYCGDCERFIKIKSFENGLSSSSSSNKFLTFLRHSVSHDCEDLELLKFLKKYKTAIESRNISYDDIQHYIVSNYNTKKDKTLSSKKNGTGISRKGRNSLLLQNSNHIMPIYEQDYDSFKLQNNL